MPAAALGNIVMTRNWCGENTTKIFQIFVDTKRARSDKYTSAEFPAGLKRKRRFANMPKKIVNVEAQSVSFEFEDKSVLTIALSELSPATVIRAALHGISQKGGDSYAGAKDEADPIAFAKAQVADVIRNLQAGDWRAASTGSGGSRISDLAKALAAATGKPVEEIHESLAEATDEQKKEFAKIPKVAAHLQRIKAEKAIERANKAAAKAEGAAEVQINI
jgi:hypothetical protein